MTDDIVETQDSTNTNNTPRKVHLLFINKLGRSRLTVCMSKRPHETQYKIQVMCAPTQCRWLECEKLFS